MQADSWSHLGIHEFSTTTVRTSHTPPGITHTHTHRHTHTHTHTYTQAHIHAHTQAHIHAHTQAHTYTCPHTVDTGHLSYVISMFFTPHP